MKWPGWRTMDLLRWNSCHCLYQDPWGRLAVPIAWTHNSWALTVASLPLLGFSKWFSCLAKTEDLEVSVALHIGASRLMALCRWGLTAVWSWHPQHSIYGIFQVKSRRCFPLRNNQLHRSGPADCIVQSSCPKLQVVLDNVLFPILFSEC